MPVVAAAVCPHPPLLVPELAGGAAPETDDLRAACAAAVRHLTDAGPDAVLIVGAGPDEKRYDASATGSFAGYGAPDVVVGLGSPNGSPLTDLPLSVLVGAWILRDLDLRKSALTVAADASPARCQDVGAEIAEVPERLALLVMGDGSARHSEHAPVHLHPRGEAFDQVAGTALGTADRSTLAALDPAIATEVAAAGRPAWQVLAAAIGSGVWRADLLYDKAPYGVGYFVATWTPAWV